MIISECKAFDLNRQVYGIILQRVPDTRKYICYSELTASSTAEYDLEQIRHLTLLFIILSYLLMKDCRVDEGISFIYTISKIKLNYALYL